MKLFKSQKGAAGFHKDIILPLTTTPCLKRGGRYYRLRLKTWDHTGEYNVTKGKHVGAVHDLAKKIAGVSKDGDIIFSRKVLEILSADQEFRFNGDRENLLPELMEGGNCFP